VSDEKEKTLDGPMIAGWIADHKSERADLKAQMVELDRQRASLVQQIEKYNQIISTLLALKLEYYADKKATP